ncbi:MAG: B12-binding domain-containing radical SAM protein [Verrucomicrobia bacterium]|jgi:radical SAM superfamily enzyme YgiQ (UPF0313 family)|nr:B12-binding domain-containing radical SAM protein [Verrucomicrobiota bacterium]
MADIVLATLNAKYIHASFGLRYLLANLGPLRERARLLEFDLTRRPVDIVESLLAHQPRILGFGIYIWNVAPTTEIVALIKRVRPDVLVVLGGPEISYETNLQPIASLADYIITGEGDLAFADLCHRLLAGDRPPEKIIAGGLPDLACVKMPYALYQVEDLAHRVLYVEASRGCPFSCEFCLSSLDQPVRQFPLPDLLAALQDLLDRGARQFKFVDRTFNLHLPTACAILEFFLARHRAGQWYHFELRPDWLPEALRVLIRQFPAGSLQFEIGVQTFNEEVAARISRRQNLAKLEENFRWLRAETGVHLHADLIAGLPGESVESFAAGFDRLVALGPQEIQFGILKRLRGVPISRHDAEWGMVYSPHPPYEILQNRLVDFTMMQRLRRFARHWDWIANSGNFIETTPRLWPGDTSPFYGFLRWSQWLHARAGRTDAIALPRLVAWVFEYLTVELGLPTEEVAPGLARDYQRGGRREVPEVLRRVLGPEWRGRAVGGRRASLKRQTRHLSQ